MKITLPDTKTPKTKIILISFLIVFGLWFFLSMYLGYQYLLFSAEKGGNRGGTFVEAIFDNVSYLPYWGVNTNDTFYQSLFFSPCVSYSGDVFVDEICHVSTDDNKSFTLTVKDGFSWSDGKEVTIDDVYFTYNEIIKNNFWKLSYLDAYHVLSIVKNEDNSLVITFPFASIDNYNFFTQYILPQHVVAGMSLDQYKTEFALNPVYGGCARIHPGSQDTTSLVLELTNCDTNVLYYQLKSFETPTSFIDYVLKSETNIVSLYSDAEPLVGYEKYNVLTDKYMTVFFNNNSSHLNHSIRRSIGGFINSSFYVGDYADYLFKDQLLFDTFWSDGSNLEHHIINKNPRLDVNKDGLERININKVPTSLNLTGTKSKLVYYLDVLPDSGIVPFYIQTDKKYTKLIISHEGTTGSITLGYDEKTSKYQYDFDIKANLAEGLNKYSIKGYSEDTIDTLADLDLYYLNLPDVDQESRSQYIEQKGKIKVIYYNDPASQYVAKRLEDIFMQEAVDQYFNFIAFDTIQEFDTKLLSKDYDIVISAFDFARRKDFSSLLLTDVPTINPSLYTNAQLASYISDYVHKPDVVKESLKSQIRDIYANDMPFVVLGQVITPFYLKAEYANFANDTVYGIEDFKRQVLSSTQIVKNARLSKDKIFSISMLGQFVDSLFK